MSNDIDELTALNRDYVASVQNCDVKRFDEILAPDFYCSNPDKIAGRPRGVSETDGSAGDDQESDRTRREDPRARRFRHHPRRHQLYHGRRPAGARALYRLLGEAERQLARGVGACVAVRSSLRRHGACRHGRGSIPAIHVFLHAGLKTWMPGTCPRHDEFCARARRRYSASNMITLRSVLPAFMLAKPSLISESFSLAEIQSSRCSLPRM